MNNAGYPASLELHKIYMLFPDEEAELGGDLRIVDESREDYLYPAEYTDPSVSLEQVRWKISEVARRRELTEKLVP